MEKVTKTNAEEPRGDTSPSGEPGQWSEPGQNELRVFRDAEGRARGIALGPDPADWPAEGEPLQLTLWAPFFFNFFPGVLARFGDRLPELASLVVAELACVGSRFSAFNLGVVFDGERVCAAASLEAESGYVRVDLELEECLDFEQLGSLDGVPVGIHRGPT